MTDGTIAALLRRGAGARGAAPAILAPGRAPMSYAALAAQAEATAGRLRELGVGRGARVAVALPGGPEMAAAFVSIAAAAGCAPLNPAAPAAELERALRGLGAAALIVDGAGGGHAERTAESLGIRVLRARVDAGGPGGAFRLEGGPATASRDPVWSGPDDVALLLHTSGTTARPKLVPLLGRNLRASAASIACTLSLGARDRCLNVMPLFHVHGLVGAVLASLEAGASVICAGGADASRVFAWQAELRPTWYTAAPAIHLALLARARSAAHVTSGWRFVRSSSAPMPAGALARLEDAFGAPVIEAYGMTEAAHQIASNPLPPGRRRPGSVGPAAGADVAIIGAGGRPLPAGEAGEVVIRGPGVMPGYDQDEAANRAAFVDGWFRTGDQGYLDDGGYLHLTGRLKEQINRGGQKIAPREVDDVLMAHPGVRRAVVFGVPHARLGEEVGAAVEMAGPGLADARALRRHAAAHLPAFKVPRAIWIVDEIPTGPAGKLSRTEVMDRVRRLGADDTATAELVEPRTALEERVAAVWRALLELPRVGVTDEFELLGGDSLLAVEMLAAVSRTEGVELPFVRFLAEGTIEAVAADIEAYRDGARAAGGLLPLQPHGGGVPIVVVPGHDGTLAGIARMAGGLGAAQPVWAFALDGAEPTSTLEDTAARCAGLVRERWPHGPYCLAGVCFGGLVAYEMARQLERAGAEVELLVLIDSLNPAWAQGQSARAVAGARVRHWREKARHHRAALAALGRAGAVRYLRGRLEGWVRYRWEVVGARLLALGVRVPGRTGRARQLYRRQMLRYVPGEYGGRVLLVVVRGRRLDAPLLGWGQVARGPVDVVEVPHRPNGALAGDGARQIAALLAERLG